MRNLILALALTTAATAGAAPSTNPYEGTIEATIAGERLDAAHKAYDGMLARWKRGQAKLDDVYAWSVRWLDAELEPTVGADTDQALKDHAQRMHDLEAAVIAQSKRGTASSVDVELARYYRVDADFRVQLAVLP
jgi:hypothetical protein